MFDVPELVRCHVSNTVVLISFIDNYMICYLNGSVAVMSRYQHKLRRVHLLFLFDIHGSSICSMSMLLNIYSNEIIMKTVKCPGKRVVVGKTDLCNIYLSKLFMSCLFVGIFVTWLVILILLSGDVHPNPGPKMVILHLIQLICPLITA